MSLFLLNNCTYKNCEKAFPTLDELIKHIETSHIDFSPKTIEALEQSNNGEVSLSHVLKFTSVYTVIKREDEEPFIDTLIKKESFEYEPTNEQDFLSSLEISNPEKNEEYFVKKTKKREKKEILFACQIVGCKKKYKCASGYNYHIKHGHKLKSVSCRTQKRKSAKKSDLKEDISTEDNEYHIIPSEMCPEDILLQF